jgi:hypothetical protein
MALIERPAKSSVFSRSRSRPATSRFPGIRLMVPLGHIRASYVRSHFGTAEMTIWDGPRRDEIVYGLVMATGGRPHARIGGQ